ncbi:hypothetical protein [Nonomuraea sp. NPDC049480]|uniref:hypothetical protein n=1 Tax=Nonomuraea sp. NPDC049480 TaxID=3364353 RepID=UPI0037A20B96
MNEIKWCPKCEANPDADPCAECADRLAASLHGIRYETITGATTKVKIATPDPKTGLTRIKVGSKSDANDWLREELGRGPLSGLFRRGGEMVFTPRVGEEGYVPPRAENEEDGPAQVRAMTALDLKTAVEIRYSLGVVRRKEIKGEEGSEEGGRDEDETPTKTRMWWERKTLPTECANHAHSAARSGDGVPNLRVLRGVTHTPIVRPDGGILDRPGYDAATGLLFLPEAGLVVPPVSVIPTPEEIKDAVRLVSSIVAEFPFVEEHHRANWFGMLFTPIMRAMLPGPYPAFVINAPSPGAGKSFLASIPRTVHGGILRAGFPETDAELTKGVLGILTETTAPVVTLDNVRGKIKSAAFEGLLTTATFSDRLLGKNSERTAPNDRVWTITANNAEIGGDLARRCYWVVIDPKMPRPHERSGFTLDLRTWVPEHRGEIIAALLTIVRGWLAAGRPTAPRKRSDDYATWDAAMAGMLSWAGFAGEFGRKDEDHLESDDDKEWREFLTEVARVMGVNRPFKVVELVETIADSSLDLTPFADGEPPSDTFDPTKLPGDLADKWSRATGKAGFVRSLGKWVANRKGRYVGDLAIDFRPDPKKGGTYRVVRFGTES